MRTPIAACSLFLCLFGIKMMAVFGPLSLSSGRCMGALSEDILQSVAYRIASSAVVAKNLLL